MFPSRRKTAPRVVGGRAMRKNNHELTRGLVDPLRDHPVIARERPGRGYRHVLGQRDVRDFLEILPDWQELCRGLSAIVLSPGNPHVDGRHRDGIIELCAWEVELVREHSEEHYEAHRDVFERLAIPCEPSDAGWVLCRFDERSARAFQLLHVLLHELGHHHDRMTTRAQKHTARGEAYAEAFAREREAVVWDRYARELALSGIPRRARGQYGDESTR